jgi:hypothetical protein
MSFLQVQKRSSDTIIMKHFAFRTKSASGAASKRNRNGALITRLNLRQLQLMKAVNNLKIGLLASSILLFGGTVDGAYAGFLGGKPGTPQKQEDVPPVPETPESQAAGQRVDRSKNNLDQARKQLDAAKAVLKAADAEFRAARADQEALALRTQAQRLADSSGLTGVPMDRVQSLPPVPKGTNIATPSADLKSALPQTGSEDRIDAPSDSSVGQEMDASQSAPTPTAAPLRP